VEELGEIEIYKEELQEEKIIDFSSLSKREKEIVMLIYFNELSIRKTAKVLGLSPSSVKVYKKRAINKLKFWCKI
jgi:DNA-directed RNA polymerase specialized sigma subunit, sigma24 homolog